MRLALAGDERAFVDTNVFVYLFDDSAPVTIDGRLIIQAVRRSPSHQLSFRDALIVEAALARGCRRLLSEDLQDGRVFDGVAVENPFRRPADSHA
jgi:predicted nucleic acid-binding protein